MIGLWAIHAFSIFPGDVADEAENREDKSHKPEDGRGEEAGDDTVVLRREAEFGRNGAVYGDEGKPDNHTAWDGEESPFSPDVCDKCGFAKHSSENSGIEGCAPDPVTGDFAITLREIPKPDKLGEDVSDERVIEAVKDPGEEGRHFEEHAFLAELVELWVAV